MRLGTGLHFPDSAGERLAGHSLRLLHATQRDVTRNLN